MMPPILFTVTLPSLLAHNFLHFLPPALTQTFLVWINEEDHMRCISMQNGGNVKEVFKRWAMAINSVEATLASAGYAYAYDAHLGYITTCPSNCGTGL